MKKTILTGTSILVMILFLSFGENEKFCKTTTIALNKVSPYYDGQWQGMGVASDGACYFGTSCHSAKHGGGFFRFDPETKQFDVLTDDLTRLVGDDITKNTPQGKCHSPVIECNGSIYLSTHLAAYWGDSVLNRYAGSYILSYDLKAKKWHNYGIVKPRYSTYSAIEVDAKRGKIYAMIVPFAPKDKAVDGNHLYQIDMKTAEKRDLGRLGDGTGNFFFFLDDRGRIWSPIWGGNGQLYCYDPDKDKLITYENAFPEPRLAMDGAPVVTASMGLAARAWTWVKPIDGGKRCLFTMGDWGGGDERLWIFDPSKSIETKEAFTPVCYIGSTFLSLALYGNRVFYIQRGDYTTERGYDCEAYRDIPPDANGYSVNNLHLKSVSLDPGDPHRYIDHGKIIDQDGRTPVYIASLAADNKGNIFMNGGWLVKPGDQPTLQYKFGTTDAEEYRALIRGEFFAWVNVSKDL
jgi:hypothetical protein